MFRSFFSFLFIIVFFSNSNAQWVNTPSGPDLIDWKKDHERMRKAKVKELRSYVLIDGKKTLEDIIQFDTSGYITSEKSRMTGNYPSHYEYEYNLNHNSYNRFAFEKGKRYCDYKNIPDGNGNSIQSFYGQPDGIFDQQTDYTYFYNSSQRVTSILGKFQNHKSEFYYTYNEKGMITKIKEVQEFNPNWYWQFTYDSLNRLIKEYWYEEDGKDTSMVGVSYWTWNADGTIQKEEGKGRGWKDIFYQWEVDTLKIDFSRGAEFGPSYKYIMHLSSDKKLVDYMMKTSPKGWKEEELWYEYSFY